MNDNFEAPKWHEMNTNNCIQSRSNHGILFHDNKLHVFGGENTFGDLNDYYILDLTKFELIWDNVSIQNMKSMKRFSYNLYGNSIFIFGGYIDELISNKLYSINIDNKSMNEIEIIDNNINITPSRDHSSCILNDKLFIFGGYDDKNYNSISSGNILYYINLKNYSLYKIELSIQWRWNFIMTAYNKK